MTSQDQLVTGRLLAIIAIATILAAASAPAVVFVGNGNAPVANPNLPAGSLSLANLKTRIGWWEGTFPGVQSTFEYHGNPADLQEAVDLFAKIQAPSLQLFIHDGGPIASQVLSNEKKSDGPPRVDWTFTVWESQSWKQLHPNSAEALRLDIFTGTAKGLDISNTRIPKNVKVIDERADMNGFKDGSAVVGEVIDMGTGKPIANATVELAITRVAGKWETAATVRSDAQGHYQFTKAPTGGFDVVASANGYAPRVVGYAELRGNTFKHFPARLAAMSKLTGMAIDQDGKATAGITIRPDEISGADDAIYTLPRKPQAVTDDKGRFELEGLPVGHTRIYAYGEHFLIADALAVRAIPSADLKIRVVATGDIKGRVVDAAGKPTSANISLRPEGGEKPGSFAAGMNVAADGVFAFESVPPGRYILGLRPSNPGPAGTIDTPIIVKAGETNRLELKP